MSKLFKGLFYVLGVVIFVVMGLEVLLRTVAADPDFYWGFRFLFVSSSAFQNRGDGIWTYRPNAVIREVAVYGMASAFPPGPRFNVEYDCRMRSNNLGLLQDDDVAPGKAVTIVVGDSYVAGQGGCPWFQRLQARRTRDQLVNAGLLGTGFDQWWRLVKFLGDQGLVIERLLIVAISNDFKRTAFNWSEPELACIDNNICPPGSDALWQSLGPDEPLDALIERATTRASSRWGQVKPKVFGRLYFDQQSFLLKFGSRAQNNLQAIIEGAKAGESTSAIAGILPQTEAALETFKTLGIPVEVLMVPQRNEVGLLGDTIDRNAAVATLNAHGIVHRWCTLTKSDFMRYDGHPNRAGYDKLVACADQTLNDMK